MNKGDRNDQIKASKDKPEKSASAQQERSEIPKFDLTEEIMAEQRKITAVRRQAPGERKEPRGQELKAKPAGPVGVQPTAVQSYEEKIIAEIVARDIERLRGGENSADSE